MRMRYLFVFVGYCLLLSSCSESIEPQNPTLSQGIKPKVNILPFPNSCILEDYEVDISKGLYIVPAVQPSEIVASSVERFIARMRSLNISTSDPAGIKVDLKIDNSASIILKNNIDESHTVEIQKNGIEISAQNFVGLNHGLNSLSQLISQEGQGNFIKALTIIDEPQFTWRGIMIDVARHWISKDILLKNIDVMSAAKMNVLHLHLSDDQGWRIESKVFPRLHQQGSKGNFYTYEDIKEIINYAYERGIRIVPEFDMPGHITSWLIGYPDLASIKSSYKLEDTYGIHRNLLDPTSQKTYAFIQLLMEEMSNLFPDEYIHVGGNELVYDQWRDNQDIQLFMDENNFANIHQLQAYFFFKVQGILEKLGKKMMAWQDALRPEMNKEAAIFQSWQNLGESAHLARLGYNAVHSEGWSLDHKLPMKDLYSINPYSNSPLSDLTIDTSVSQYWEFDVSVGDSAHQGLLILYGRNHNLNGIISVLNRNFVIKNAKISNGRLRIESKSNVGQINSNLDVSSLNEISGQLNLEMMTLPLQGKKVGGNNITSGKKVPPLHDLEELNLKQKEKILGGEACMWSEWVTNDNILSRIWPSSSAIAEKLWSQDHLTTDVENFYSRSSYFTKYLNNINIEVEGFKNNFIAEFEDDILAANIRTYISNLEEVKFLGRYRENLEHSQGDVLNGIADIVSPESLSSYQFACLVDKLEANGPDKEIIEQITDQLDVWIPIYRSIKSQIQNNGLLAETEVLALSLSDLSKIAEHVLKSGTLTSEEDAYYDQLKLNAQREINGVFLAPAIHLIRIIDRYRTEL